MATDGPTPPPCNPDIYKNGETVCIVSGSTPAQDFEIVMGVGPNVLRM